MIPKKGDTVRLAQSVTMAEFGLALCECEPIDGAADEGVCRSEAAGGQLITASVVSTVVSLFLVSCSRLR